MLYLCNELGHAGLSLSVKPNHLGATEENNSVLPISNAEETLCHLHPAHFVPAPLDDSYPLPAPCFSLLLCHVTQGPYLLTHIPEDPSWKLMSKGERELISKLHHIKGERDLTS